MQMRRFLAALMLLLGLACSNDPARSSVATPMDGVADAQMGQTDMVNGGVAGGAGDTSAVVPSESQDPAASMDEPSLAPDGNCTVGASASRPCHNNPDPCGLNSGWQGDEYCILPPAEGEGIQIHFGPTDFSDQAQIDEYALRPGEEFNAYGIANIPTTEDHYYKFVQLRMRPGSHHLINRVVTQQQGEGFVAGFDCPGTVLESYFVGSQNLVRDDPANGVIAPENVGLGRLLPGNASLCINQHAYNFTDEAMMREIWINVYFMDDSEVTQTENRIALNADIGSIAPGVSTSLTVTGTAIGNGRITTMYGHRHAWTERFAVWLNDELVYDSWDWVESVVFDYNSVTQNPALNPALQVDGSVSGVLTISNGDRIRMQCDINNMSDNTLRFENSLFDGEMCILFGASVGTRITGGFGF